MYAYMYVCMHVLRGYISMCSHTHFVRVCLLYMVRMVYICVCCVYVNSCMCAIFLRIL